MRRAQFKGTLQWCLSRVWRQLVAPRVIYYHSIAPSQLRSMDPKLFAHHIDWLLDTGFKLQTFSELVCQVLTGKMERDSVCITFDDGYHDNYEYAFPLLLEKKVTATFFVTTALIQDKPQHSAQGYRLYENRTMMTKAQLREMHSSGMEIASHTRNHVHLQRVLKQDKSRAWDEVYGSRQELQDILGDSVVAFAYPYGQRGVFSEQTRGLLENAGYSYAAISVWGYLSNHSDPLQIPRNEIRTKDQLNIFSQKMQGQWDFLHSYAQLRRRNQHW